MIWNKIVIFCLGIISVLNVCAMPKDTHNNAVNLQRDSLVSDFLFFCDMLEETHPDPYTGFGGRPAFRISRDLMAHRLANDSLSLNDFSDLLNEFLVPLSDLHTYVQYPQSGETNTRYVQRIKFDVLNDGLMLSGIAQPYSKYLGSRLVAINGVSIDSLAERMTRVETSENQFGNLQNLSSRGNQDLILNKLGISAKDSVSYQLITLNSDTVILNLPIVEREHLEDVEMVRLSSSLTLPQNNLQFELIDNEDNTMYLRLSSMMARENYRYSYEMGWNNAMDDIYYYYQSAGKEMPESIDEAIDSIPSFSEEFSKMLMVMKENGAENLIIDMRGNPGGWSAIAMPSLMMMYGDDYFRKDFETKSVRLLSNLYLHKLNKTIDQLNQSWGTQFKVGDYFIISDYQDADIATLRNWKLRTAMTETPDLLQSLDGQPLYRPKKYSL